MKVLTTNIPLGAVVDIDFGLFTHRALVSSRTSGGKPMLISATRRTGTVLEEHWDAVVQGNPVKLVARPQTFHHGLQLVERARAYIRRWRYHVKDANCEHFVSLVVTGKAFSPQVRGWLTLGGLVLAGGLLMVAARGK